MSKKIKRITQLISAASFAISAPVYAAVSQEGWNPQSLEATNLPKAEVKDILLKFIDWAIIIVGLLCIIVFIYGGFLYLTAQGETDKIETAKRVLIYAVIGVVVSVLGLVVVNTVNYIMNASPDAGTAGGAPASGASTTPAGSTGAPTAPPGGSPSGPTVTPAPPSPGGQLPIAPNMTGQ